MNQIILLYCFMISISSCVLIYRISPLIYLYVNDAEFRRLKEERYDQQLCRLVAKLPVNEKAHGCITDFFNRSGIRNGYQLVGLILCIFLTVAFTIYGARNLGIPVHTLAAFLAGGICIAFFCYKNKADTRNRIFIMNAYRIYHFLHSQITSGIKATDAVKGLHEIVDHPVIKNVFIRFVAQYELTLNIGESLHLLRRSFPGFDSDMLCVSIEQCIHTGMAGRTLLKMEQIMFSKYFHYLQKETETYRTKLLISGIFAIVPVMMIFLFPMIYEALKGFEQILDSAVIR